MILTRLSLFIILATGTFTTICMESSQLHTSLLPSTLPYSSIQRPSDRYDTVMPYTLSDYCDFLDSPNATIVRSEDENDRLDTCFTVSITETLGITGKAPQHLKIGIATDLLTECHVVEKYYQQIANPSPGCLAIYSDESDEINHAAIVTSCSADNNPAYCMVKSKWGNYPCIIEHELFHTPQEYGNTATFFSLKPEFQHNKQFMLQQIKTDIAQSTEIKKYLHISQIMLLRLANGKDLTNIESHLLNQKINLYEKARYMLKVCMGLNINTRNQKHETVLMLATKRNDIDMIKLFLGMGANKSLCDKNGNTALSIAQKFSYYRAVELLQ